MLCIKFTSGHHLLSLTILTSEFVSNMYCCFINASRALTQITLSLHFCTYMYLLTKIKRWLINSAFSVCSMPNNIFSLTRKLCMSTNGCRSGGLHYEILVTGPHYEITQAGLSTLLGMHCIE